VSKVVKNAHRKGAESAKFKKDYKSLFPLIIIWIPC